MTDICRKTVSAGMEKSDVINFSSLEKELQAALEADRKYQRENDAKFRALNQNVGSYEEFRDIVLASHLKPLDRKDISGAPRKQPWNPIAFGTKHESASSEELQPQLSKIQPKSASEFISDWRRFAGSSFEKYRLLVSLGGKTLQKFFSTEIGLGLLGEFLLILSQCLKSGHEENVIGVLDGLSRTGRFGLNLSLLSRVEQKACEELFHKLHVAVGQCPPPKNYSSDISVVCETSVMHIEKDETDITAKLKELTAKYGIGK